MQITDTDNEFVKIWKKNRRYHGLYIQRDILLLADVFEKFWNACLEIYEFDPASFRTAPALKRPK